MGSAVANQGTTHSRYREFDEIHNNLGMRTKKAAAEKQPVGESFLSHVETPLPNGSCASAAEVPEAPVSRAKTS